MKQYRFSPIKNKDELFKALEYIHLQAHKICKQNFGRLLPVAGNIGVFCHFKNEFDFLTQIRKELTDIHNHWNHKYFKLYQPIIFPAKYNIPETKYTYLYVRKPDDNTPNVEDVDFYLELNEYKQLKQEVISGKFENNLRMFERPDLDMIRLINQNVDVSVFITSYNLEEVAINKK